MASQRARDTWSSAPKLRRAPHAQGQHVLDRVRSMPCPGVFVEVGVRPRYPGGLTSLYQSVFEELLFFDHHVESTRDQASERILRRLPADWPPNPRARALSSGSALLRLRFAHI